MVSPSHLASPCSRPGGDKIYHVFDNQLPAALKRLQFDKHLSMDNVRKLITEADGYQPHLIAPEQGYRRLIESTLVTIKGPAEAAVDAVCFFCCSYLNLHLIILFIFTGIRFMLWLLLLSCLKLLEVISGNNFIFILS